MRGSRQAIWITLLTSGLGVAALTFVANKAWDAYRHRSVGPRYVDGTIRSEEDKLIVFLRNRSDEPLDLKRATISVDEPGLASEKALGAYPDISKVYTASATSGTAKLAVVNDQLVVTVDIAQAIKPGEADQFGVALTGVLGPVNLGKAKIRADLEDLKGNRYVITR
jgi:hypothetical protein